ncbi:protein phosphatase 2C domain-containing protein [Catellatospora sp. KI3]|uniref:protein phosphatase 2C domain-containing protein n=1 Tax=Catellatospora sp. KI3 TaxID=3041620 RepID=UPI00248327DD|nr:protein phosphatase 2C domain-containing protein [Catellatospora sp. KI3]MDI1464021.1 protein phosphatase 2C domain-containing protein [Catellatospora sp. KI3]
MATSGQEPGRVNEDFAGAVAHAVVLLDGAGIRGAEAICRHGVAWYTHRLGGALLHRLSVDDGRDLAELLAEAIGELTDAHRDTCDVTDPSSPSATVAMLRFDAEQVEYLLLGDSVILLDRIGREPLVVTDRREVEFRQPLLDALGAHEPGSAAYERVRAEGVSVMRANRNHPGGFWVAKDEPGAAAEAVTGSLPVTGLTAAALLSNGASRIADRYALADWPEVLSLLGTHGPAEVVDRVREAERRPGGAAPDDATVAYCVLPRLP